MNPCRRIWSGPCGKYPTSLIYPIYLDRSAEHADVIGPRDFKAADADQDNRISAAEFDAFMDRLRSSANLGDNE